MLQVVLALVAQVMAMVPKMVEIGVNAAPLLAWGREVLDANSAPGDAEWDRLDAFISEWQPRFRAAAAERPAEPEQPVPEASQEPGSQQQ